MSDPLNEGLLTAGERIGRRGLMLVISSPSGAGKTTLARQLLESDGGIVMSVSATTRPPRPGEVDGRDYHFRSDAQFDSLIADDALLEWATVFDNRYGTPRAEIEARLEAGQDVLFDIDWQGAEQLAGKMPADLVRVFVLPPSMAALEARLRSRKQDADDVIARRMQRAADEISHWAQYDYVIVNDDLAASSAALTAILRAERLRRFRQTGLADFVRDMGA